MMSFPEGYRPARLDDVVAMTELVNMAGEGLPEYLWSGMAAEGQSPWLVGQGRAAREEGGFSYRNTVVCEISGCVVASLVGYPLDDVSPPVDYSAIPEMFVPLQQLEDLASGTWYVNVLAVYPAFRGRGIGAALLSLAEVMAANTAKVGLSIIVADTNVGARRLYERQGYRELARRPMVKQAWSHPGNEWVLLVKSL